MDISPIAYIKSDFREKFGIPRQSGVVAELQSLVIFEPECRNIDCLRGIEEYDYLWLIWEFSANGSREWSPTVRPPRLGGNVRRGVFATRSPYRPNPLGLSSVKLEAVKETENGPVLLISGADLMDGTPIYDIKPYISLDLHPDARYGLSGPRWERLLEVNFPPSLLDRLPPEKRSACIGVLRQDPRPAYQHDPSRVYGVSFAGFDIHFRVEDGVLYVEDVVGP